MARVAFVTCEQYPQLTPDDQVAATALQSRGVEVIPVIWSQPSTSSSFDLVVLRSMWDYHLHPEHFSEWLDQLEATGLPVWNPVALARWNSDKRYLRDLQERGVAIVPTTWHERGAKPDVGAIMD